MKRKVIIISIIIVEIIMIGIIAIPKKEEPQLLEEVKVIDKKDNNSLAIMLKGKNETEYKKSEDETWPTETYMYSGTSCIDNTGKQIGNPGIVSFDNTTHTATITTKDTVYCYLYFSEPNDVIELVSQSPNLENAEDVSARGDVLRRFQGTAEKVNDNYICFGTNNPDECVNNTDKYMYRIMGYAEKDDESDPSINSNTKQGQLKLQKKEALPSEMQWHSETFTNIINWGESDLYNSLNGNSYWNLPEYMLDEWKEKVAEHIWITGEIMNGSENQDAHQIGEKVFAIESGRASARYAEFLGEVAKTLQKPEGALEFKVVENTTSPYKEQSVYYKLNDDYWTKKVESKVGLINISDYYLSVGANTNCRAENEVDKCKSGWMHLSNNDNKVVHSDDWTISGFGFHATYGDHRTNAVTSSGRLIDGPYYLTHYARPVIYTIAGLQIIGDGTLNNPYVITN